MGIRAAILVTRSTAPLGLTSHHEFTTESMMIAGSPRTVYRFDMDSHSDLSAGATPLAKALGMPPAERWQAALSAFHPLTLHVYYTFWYDGKRDATIVVYAVSSAFTPKSGAPRDNGPAIDTQLRDMMRRIRLEYARAGN